MTSAPLTPPPELRRLNLPPCLLLVLTYRPVRPVVITAAVIRR
jgi:hypothetical protein